MLLLLVQEVLYIAIYIVFAYIWLQTSLLGHIILGKGGSVWMREECVSEKNIVNYGESEFSVTLTKLNSE